MSEAAFTDSTTAHASPAATTRPGLGSSMNTRSPSASCAWSVMPTAIVPSPSLRIHSCVVVYLSWEGTFIGFSSGSFDEDLSIAHERRLDHARGHPAVANLDLDGVADGDADRHPRERDRRTERRRERSARDLH